MTREMIIELISTKIRLIRTEFNYTQEKMAFILGISKKTLVQIEKGRQHAPWTVVIAVCALFSDSEMLQQSFGGNPLEVMLLISHQTAFVRKEKTLGGKIWWKDLSRDNGFILQQNIVSNHYRVLDQEHYRYISTFSLEEAKSFIQNPLADAK